MMYSAVFVCGDTEQCIGLTGCQTIGLMD